MVVRKSTGQYWVAFGGTPVPCSLSSRLRKQLIYPIADPTSLRHRVKAVKAIAQVDPVAIGDRVRFVDAGDGSGMIVEVLPRKNKLVRRAAGARPLEQVIVANVDQVIAIMAAAYPAPKWELLDRYLSAAADLDLPALILITKMDLIDASAVQQEIESYRRIGYPVLLTSALTGAGIDQLQQALAGRLSVLIGLSGVGKTTLLNTIQPELGRRVGEISQATNKGKHTTTNLEMFPLDGGGHLVDTPGMREFGLWDLQDDDLAGSFLEMRPYLGQCRFGASCTHLHEPGCAIKEAVAAGHIAARRYQSYLRMR
ncbi:MAG TPA: ribosome small subunit-dependent GTPase A [Chloroflexota bacterium]|nr:ribosome small subunit-dependent GTPase A [Chloroflexota bacterium]